MQNPQIPIGLVGYTFSKPIQDAVVQINSANFSLTKFANSEAEALSLAISDTKEYLKYLEDRSKIIGNVPILSPFVAEKK